MKDFLELIMTNLFGEEVEFSVSEETESNFIRFVINIDEDYKARLIGKGGRTISSIYNVINIIAKKEGKRIKIDVAD